MSGLSCDQIWTIKGRSISNFIIYQFVLRPSRTFSPTSSLTLSLASLTHLSSYPPPPPTPLITLVHAIRATLLCNQTMGPPQKYEFNRLTFHQLMGQEKHRNETYSNSENRARWQNHSDRPLQAKKKKRQTDAESP
ncbi:hypothetical protein FGO68_gene15829 [Halteria grandinella]|uniref:Uncharacterized protein n=1 Tax=Halteria grandinella TaxID=5974 RepID=A0A8J8NIN0_HALGN|nr:hypothetical protein FGO68_gene15829 [Halteria grandinella]